MRRDKIILLTFYSILLLTIKYFQLKRTHRFKLIIEKCIKMKNILNCSWRRGAVAQGGL